MTFLAIVAGAGCPGAANYTAFIAADQRGRAAIQAGMFRRAALRAAGRLSEIAPGNNHGKKGNPLMNKTRILRAALAIAATLGLASLATTASATPPKRLPTIKPDESTAVVSFIRRTVFMGDGWNYDVWDGEEWVGVLGAGNLLQHRAKPGQHVYLLMARGVHLWAYMKADVVAGKEYFARAFPIPFSLQPVDSNSDERVETWAAMPIARRKNGDKEKWTEKFGAELQLALAAYRNGEISADCGVWIPPNKKGEESKQPAADSGCRPIGEMKPEMGR
jgi:hypothetical protein